MTTRPNRLPLGAAGMLILCAVASHAHLQSRGTQPVARETSHLRVREEDARGAPAT